MGLLRRLRGPGALVLLMVTLAACTPAPPPGHVEYAVRYNMVSEVVVSADAVVVGRVAETSRGRVLDQEDVVFTMMNVRVVVEHVWAGQMPTATLTIERFGWENTARRPGWRGWFDVAGEREWRVEDELRLKQGHRGIFFLARTNGAPGWYGLAPEGLYLIDGAEVVDTDRSYPLVRKVESMTVAQLQGAVADAVAAVRRGELKPKQAPTG
jgi:hypothetical protein